MIPSEYESIIQMLLNEMISLRRQVDTQFKMINFTKNQTTSPTFVSPTGTRPITYLKETTKIKKQRRNPRTGKFTK